MTNIGFDRPLYILPFDHRGSFQTKMFGWKGSLTSEQTSQIAAAKRVIYDGFLTAVAGGVPFDHRGSFQTKMFGWKGSLTSEQTSQIAAAKRVIYDGFLTAVAGGVPAD